MDKALMLLDNMKITINTIINNVNLLSLSKCMFFIKNPLQGLGAFAGAFALIKPCKTLS